MTYVGKHAIVIGAGMGGLMAARALADHYDEVTIFERDALPDSSEPRKGLPQGKHSHGLLARGREILEQLFPGFTEQMVNQGAMSADILNDGLWFNHGVYLCSAPSKMRGLGASRPMLEAYVRRRLVQLPNIRVRDQHRVVEPVFDRQENRVSGARVQPTDGSDDRKTINADLVVDASGRGSSSPIWLSSFGFEKLREEQITVDVGYATRLYRRKSEHIDVTLDGRKFVLMAPCWPEFRFGALLPQEGDRWTVSLGGYMGDHPPLDEAGFLEFARSLQKPEIFNVIKDAEPLTPPASYKFVSNLRRYYEKLSRFPEGYLVYGDALCSLDPVYGQGMTVACSESLALRECLEEGPQEIAHRFFRQASRLIETPWKIAVGGNLQNPRVPGKRTAQARFVNWYIAKLYQAAQSDAVLASKFLEVANLMREPSVLLGPGIALKLRNGTPQGNVESHPELEVARG